MAMVTPHGFFESTLEYLTPGQTVVVTITLPFAMPSSTEYWMYGPTLSDPSNHWYQVPIGSNDGDNIITFTLTDGGLGDDDLSANGVIVGVGAPGRLLCTGPDLDCSGAVNALDLSVLVSQWGQCAGCPADLDGNGWVNLADLSILVSQWGN